jgi:hypothetical protein
MRDSLRSMSSDELIVTIAATVIGLAGWLWRIVRLARARFALSLAAARAVPGSPPRVVCAVGWRVGADRPSP